MIYDQFRCGEIRTFARYRYVMIIKFSLCILLMVPMIVVAQTCVIAVKSKKEIVIGADSKAGSRIGPPSFACKLLRANNYVFSFSGYIYDGMIEKVSAILKSSSSFENGITNLWQTLMPIMNQKYEDIREKDFDSYKKIFPDTLACKILVCAFENGVPYMETLIFGLKNPPSQPVFVNPYLRPNVALNSKTVIDYDVLGAADCLNELSKDSAENRLGRRDKPEQIYKLIERQSEITPNHVGKPINVLILKSDNTVKWIHKSNQCGTNE